MLRASLTMPRGDPYGVGCSCHWLCWRKETDLSVASGKCVVLEQPEAMKLSCSKTQIKVEIFRSHQHGSRRFMQMDVGQSYTFSIIVRVSL